MLMENYVCHNIFYPLNNSFCPQDSIPPLKNFAPWQMNAFLIRGNTHILCLELPLHNPIADQENKTFAPSSEVLAQEITCKDILFIFEKLIVLKRLPTPYQHQQTPITQTSLLTPLPQNMKLKHHYYCTIYLLGSNLCIVCSGKTYGKSEKTGNTAIRRP